MGMPVAVDIADTAASAAPFERVFDYLRYVDAVFSTYKKESEISLINAGVLNINDASSDMQEVFALAEEMKKRTEGYFDITRPDGSYDPSGLVKGWAIRNAKRILKELRYENFYIDIAGDIASSGSNNGKEWSVGIRSPFSSNDIVKVVYPRGRGIATSGTYIRGLHIYDPHAKKVVESPYVSLTVVGEDICEVDCFATAAFAMQEKALPWLDSLESFEAYGIAHNGVATMTRGFESYTNI